MSYSVQLYRKEVKDKQLQSKDDSFFEKNENLIPFTKEQKDYLTTRLSKYGYTIEKENEYGIHFSFKDDDGISVLLGNSGLYFSSTGEGIFEISMTASEFTDTDEFSKYDPQDGSWEEI
jgi:hypothetical protein